MRRLWANTAGVAVVEFALVAPLLLMILLGIVGFGGYFWRAHALQQVANDAARASLAGLTATERASLARDRVTAELPAYSGLSVDRATVSVSEGATSVSVALDYDSGRDPFFHLGFANMPGAHIRRSATVMLGGL